MRHCIGNQHTVSSKYEYKSSTYIQNTGTSFFQIHFQRGDGCGNLDILFLYRKTGR